MPLSAVQSRKGSPTPVGPTSKRKTHVPAERPPFERIALILQGGGALGAYQAGVYQALAEADLHPDWVSGISIGAVNAAIIAGNPPEKRVQQLRAFWETVTQPPFRGPQSLPWSRHPWRAHARRRQSAALVGHPARRRARLLHAAHGRRRSCIRRAALRPSVSTTSPRSRPRSSAWWTSTASMPARCASASAPSMSAAGNFVYFDNTTHEIGPAHVIASGSLPPGFPPTEIEGEHYWDGGLVSNTPLEWVLDSRPRQDTLAFQIDLWSATGEFPRNLIESDLRQKDIRFSSRTRAATDEFKKEQLLRRAAAKLLAKAPETLRQTPEAELLASEADEKVYNLIQLIYRMPRLTRAPRKTTNSHA